MAASALFPVLRAAFLAVAIVALAAGCTPRPLDLPASPSPSSAADPGSAGTSAASCDGAPSVRTADELTAALDAARPGSIIALADGTYAGSFVAQSAGTTDEPITLCGSRAAILDGGTDSTDYTLYLYGAAHWNLEGFTVRGGKKTLMLDSASHNVLRGLAIGGSADEALHLRAGSSDNLIEGNEISAAGLKNPDFGEGIYIGTAESNWCEYSACQPDHSDRNRIIGNTISATTSESIDVKEGTSGGEISGNTIDGSGITQADSLLDIKGGGWTVTGNTGANSPGDGVQVHLMSSAPGTGNSFAANTFSVSGTGVGINIVGAAAEAGNVVLCDNTVARADQVDWSPELSNQPCSSS